MIYYSGGTGLLNPVKIFQRVGIAQDMKIGDFGCGASGVFPLQAAKLVGKDGLVYAVDIMKHTLREVSTKARLEGIENIKTIWSNLEVYKATKINDNSCDLGLLINILFQTKLHENIIKECIRMIKNKGTLLVIDWKQTDIVKFGPPIQERIKSEYIKNIAMKLRLKLKEEFSAGKYHFGLIFAKE